MWFVLHTLNNAKNIINDGSFRSFDVFSQFSSLKKTVITAAAVDMNVSMRRRGRRAAEEGEREGEEVKRRRSQYNIQIKISTKVSFYGQFIVTT